MKFEDLNLSDKIQKAINDMGFIEMTPIQEQVIPYIMEGKDLIGQAQTGTGKTAAFGIPVLEMIDAEDENLQTVILCPTRELAIQVTKEFKKMAKYKKNINVLAVYGGQPIETQIKTLKKGVQIIVGTPGRVMDHMNRHTLKMGNVKIAILDEADEMLDMGFREDIELILSKIPQQRQTLMFSATMPKPILELTGKYQKDPEFIKVVHRELTVPNIDQFYFEVKEQAKPDILSRLIDIYNLKLSLVFCNTKKRVDGLVEELQIRGYLAEGLHGDMTQKQREFVMGKFRKGYIAILVATDVAARGIDVDDIEAVFNYDIPLDEEDYVHRIGRTARAGKTGVAFSFVAPREIYRIRDIQRYANTKIKSQKIPSINDVNEIRTKLFLEKVKKAINEGELEKYRDMVNKLLKENNALDIAAGLLKMVMDNETKQITSQESKFENIETEDGMVRLFINVGKRQRIQPKDIVGSIASEAGIPGKAIGAIDIFDKYTFVDVEKKYAADVLIVMNNNQIKGNRINVEHANK